MYFFWTIQTLNQPIPQTLPRQVLQYSNENLIRNFLQLYHISVENETETKQIDFIFMIIIPGTMMIIITTIFRSIMETAHSTYGSPLRFTFVYILVLWKSDRRIALSTMFQWPLKSAVIHHNINNLQAGKIKAGSHFEFPNK